MSDILSARGSSRASTVAPSVRNPSRVDSQISASTVNIRRLRQGSTIQRQSISHRVDQSTRQMFQKLENTYRMEPEDKDRFQPGTVEKMLGSLLESFLDGELYEARKCSQIAQNLTDVIKARLKELSLPRYRLLVNVMIGQNAGQSLSFASRSVWNATTDNFASASYHNETLFAVATVFAVYRE